MTTIAYRDGVLAADSRVTVDYGSGARKHTCKKLFRKRVTEGKKSFDVIIATAGESSPGMVFVDWYGSGTSVPDIFLHIDADFTCLVLTPDGLFEYDTFCRGEKIEEDFYAIGSGAMAALAAMHCGKSALDAVRIAARVDTYTGGRIVTETLESPKRK
jgi:ATP-dependent protease HslVU (ClpYQ) peptidase subunit